VDAQKMGKMVMSMRASFDSSLFGAGSDRLALTPGSVGPSLSGREVQRIGVPVQNNFTPKEVTSTLSPKSDAGSGRNLIALKRNVEMLFGKGVLGSKIRTRMDGRGLVISLGEGGFFDSGSDVLKQEGRTLLDSIANTLARSPNQIRVEGHTDNVPIRNSRFPSNWELSTSRATTIIAHLITNFGFAPDRLSAAGYAEYRPEESNDTAEGRAHNRRVDIVVLSPRSALVEP
jgi:chemotaxis protein MotB